MNEADLRQILHRRELLKFRLNEPSTLIVHEMGILEGAYRIDVAMVNGALHGYEIKSTLDNLNRLPAQQAAYKKVFDRLTLVADEHHVEAAMRIVPPCWGLMVAGIRNGAPYIDEIFQPRMNFEVEPFALCQLLWRDEALKLLSRKKMSAGMWNKPRRDLWRKLADEVDLVELKGLVRETLKKRRGWARIKP